MIDLYTAATPNGRKVSIMLEEVGAPYTVKALNLRDRENFSPDFQAISPNHKIPAIVDHAPMGLAEPFSLYESGAILQYLSAKYAALGGDTATQEATVQSWCFFQASFIGPNLGTLHYFTIQEEQNPGALAYFQGEVQRGLTVLERQLADNAYLAGDSYTIADIMVYPWLAMAWRKLSKNNPDVKGDFPALERWLVQIGERPAVIKGMAVPP